MKGTGESKKDQEKDDQIRNFFESYGLPEGEDEIMYKYFNLDDIEPVAPFEEPNYVGLQPTDIEETEKKEEREVEKKKRSTPQKKAKVKVDLTDEELQFKFSLYHLFVSRKKFDKRYVKQIHNLICDKINIPKLQREEERSIDLYFKNRIKYMNSILVYINTHKKEILNEIPELKNEIL